MGESAGVSYAEIAARLGNTEVAVQSAVARLRRRFRAVVRELIAGTLDNPSEIKHSRTPTTRRVGSPPWNRSIARRPESIRKALVAALDDWTAIRKRRVPKGPDWSKPIAVARAADADPDRDSLRAGLLLSDQADGLKLLRAAAIRLKPESTDQSIVEIERQDRSPRLPSILRGDEKPKTAAEGIAFAEIAYLSKRFAAAARLYAEAFKVDPKLSENMKDNRRYNAACSAALSAAGQGIDDPIPKDVEKTRLRKQTMEWLKADLAYWTKLVADGKKPPEGLTEKTLRHWKADADLSSVRDSVELAKMPQVERQQWSALWNEVDALIEKAK